MLLAGLSFDLRQRHLDALGGILHAVPPRLVIGDPSFYLATSFFSPKEEDRLMCGRFARYSLSRALELYFNALPPSFEIQPNYNVAPTQEIPVIVQLEDARHIKKRHWGLVPFWAKDTSIGSRMINARVETLASKPAFKAALKHRRCLIPANGFFEWAGKAGSKQPYFICLPSRHPNFSP